MIDKELAQSLVRRLHRQFGYNINIMDEKAIIIASSDVSRIGQFHEGAYKIIKEKCSCHVIDESEKDSLIGIDCGVTLPLNEKGQIIGAFGVTGDPEETIKVAKILRLTFNTMLDHENQKNRKLRQNNKANELINSLFFSDDTNIARIKRSALENMKSFNCYRIPVLLRINDIVSKRICEILEQYQSGNLIHKQDIPFLVDGSVVAIIKHISDGEVIQYKDYARKFIKNLVVFISSLFGCEAIKYACCDIPIRDIPDYKTGFQHLLWMDGEIIPKHETKITFFTDCIYEYLSMPKNTESNLYILVDFYLKIIKEHIGVQNYCDFIDALYQCNGHTEDMAKKLYIHKNTVIQRMKKIKKVLEIENMRNISEINFMYYLCLNAKKIYQEE